VFIKSLTALVMLSMLLISCGPKAFVKGDYQDPQKENLLNDQWSETDMQNVVKDLVASLLASPEVIKHSTKPAVIVTKLQNKTSEHIDTQSIMDYAKVELMKSGKMAFIDKEAREDISDEYNYQNSGMVSDGTKKGPGAQIGADYVLNGRLDSIVQEVGKEKTVFYKVTLNLTDLKTSMIVWTDHKQMRKYFKKKSVGL
jgi:penicillin-binding protein activator